MVKSITFVTMYTVLGSAEGFYLLILIGCDCGELSLWEGEAVHSFSRQRLDLRQVHPRVVLDDVHTGLVFMHRLKDYLDEEMMFSILQLNHHYQTAQTNIGCNLFI